MKPPPAPRFITPPAAASRRHCAFALAAAAALAFATPATPAAPAAAGFTRLDKLPPPRICDATGGVFINAGNPVENLVDDDPVTEFASAGKGLHTFVEFDFGKPAPIAGFRHQDRRNGTIAASELIFLDDAGNEITRVPVAHADRGGAVVFKPIQPAVTARRVRWQVAKLGKGNAASVGGAEITFYTTGKTDATPDGITIETLALPITGKNTPAASSTAPAAPLTQPLKLNIDYPYAEPLDATVTLGDAPARPVRLQPGPQTLDFTIPISKQPRALPLAIAAASTTTAAPASQQPLYRADIAIPAFREITIYITPHSHHDIGYTEIQTAIEEKQLNNLLVAMDAADRTADYPEGSRFVWNLEGTWTADRLLRCLDDAHREKFYTAVRQGRLAIDAMYFNVLTGLCRPEELISLFRLATELRAKTGATIDSAMISDVPGYTWGTVTALAQARVKYLSPAANTFDRVGATNLAWENKPFWWIGPSGAERILVWAPFGGYNYANRITRITPEWAENFLTSILRANYPYDTEYIRWSRGDNGTPDTALPDQVRDWNATHAWPRLVIASIHDAFSALEKTDAARIPEYRGDWTPYWEDGAGSSAAETAENRASSDRLNQAAALWTMLAPATYPARDFADAMRHILLYSEHTWGASASVTAPASLETQQQWAIKRAYAATAATQTRALLERARALAIDAGPPVPAAIDLYNTTSWPRTELVTLPRDYARAGDNRVLDDTGAPVPTQRLTTGELVMLAENIPPFSARRYTITTGPATAPAQKATATATPATLDNAILHLALDPATGGITELRAGKNTHNFAGTATGETLNDYLYFNGDDPATARGATNTTIRVKERGPLVASLTIESTAPGCHALTREIRLVAGRDAVDITNIVDKARLVAKDYRAPEGKESVNFAFPFNVPAGQVRIESPLAITRPDADQIPGACKNWFTAGRWADISNATTGITWVTLDAPLVQVGALTANLLNSQTNPNVWRKQTGPAQKLYAWVMNNHWGTNYRAWQEGPVTFRFILRPHAAYDPAAATRLAIAASQPLIPARAHGEKPPATPRLALSTPDVIVFALKPSDDGRALIARLWNTGQTAASTTLTWSSPAPRRVTLSDTSEEPLAELPPGAPVEIPASGVVTLRAELQ